MNPAPTDSEEPKKGCEEMRRRAALDTFHPAESWSGTGTRIYTRCPSCHNDTLTINDDKHLLCTWIECKDPTLIDRIDEVLSVKAIAATPAESRPVSETPRTDEAVARIEAKHTHVVKNVTTNYKAAFIELGFEMGDLERESSAQAKRIEELEVIAYETRPQLNNGIGITWSSLYNEMNGLRYKAIDERDTHKAAAESAEKERDEARQMWATERMTKDADLVSDLSAARAQIERLRRLLNPLKHCPQCHGLGRIIYSEEGGIEVICDCWSATSKAMSAQIETLREALELCQTEVELFVAMVRLYEINRPAKYREASVSIALDASRAALAATEPKPAA